MNAQKTTAIIISHGGVGDFLFQLDLAKRLELSGIKPLFLIRKNFSFLSQIVAASNVTHSKLIRADGSRYLLAMMHVWMRTLIQKTVIINSFHFTHLRLPTRMLYAVSRLLGGRVLVCMRMQAPSLAYEQLVYEKGELIWQRNNRIAAYVCGAAHTTGFPVLTFKKDAPYSQEGYIHIHPVASSLEKSYPSEKLLDVLEALGERCIVLTMTPDAEAWYMTGALRAYLASHPNIALISKYFALTEIAGFVAGAKVFCTVNTGLLWLGLMLGQRLVVCDIETEYEWNPDPYGAIRLLRPEGAQVAKVLMQD